MVKGAVVVLLGVLMMSGITIVQGGSMELLSNIMDMLPKSRTQENDPYTGLFPLQELTGNLGSEYVNHFPDCMGIKNQLCMQAIGKIAVS